MKIITSVIFILIIFSGYSQPTIDSYTLSSVLTIEFKDTTYVGNATGFFIKVNNTVYFITNNHVVGGEFYKNEYKELHGHFPPVDSIPNNLKVRLYESKLNYFRWEKIELNDSMNVRRWIKFYEDEKDIKTLLDVVAIPIDSPKVNFFGNCSILSIDNTKPSLSIYPAQELFVVGFPYNTGLKVVYPFWKRATISSDPTINSSFYIDATTRGGMSGSPVFYRNTTFINKQGQISMGALAIPPEPVYTFLVGIYRSQDVNTEIGGVVKLDKVFEKLLKISK